MNLDLTKYYRGRFRILWHILFWLSYWLYHSLIYGSYEQDYLAQFQWESFYLPVKMAATYLTLYVLLPRYFLNRKYVEFALTLAGSFIIAAVIQRALDYAIVYRIMDPSLLQEPFFNTAKILKIVIGIYPVVALAAFIKLAKYWYERDRQTQELEKGKLEAELKFLKAQVHPHFLFNTLNNLYALTLKQSKKASEVVLRLSSLLKYMLYEGIERQVKLQKELDVIETYISLEKIRYGDRLDVSYNVTGETGDKEIPPMLLIPFVENSFKHGTGEQSEQVWINIGVEVNGNHFKLMVENSKNSSEPIDETGYKEGIGLKNVQRRLKLLYGDDYDLQIVEEPATFLVILKLKLNCILKPEAV
jgi:sensor histidine kinase YesM